MPAEGQRSSQEHELAILIESVLDYAILLLDPTGRVLTWNRGAERIKGYVVDEIVGERFEVFYTPEDRQRGHPDHVLSVAKRDGRYEEEGWRLRKDGRRFWASVVLTSIHEGDGRHIGFGKVVRDLTARRNAEDRLRESATELDQFRRLVTSVRDYAIFMLDKHGHVATWNAGAQNIKGYAASDIIGRHFSTFYTDDDRARGHPARELEIAEAEGRYEEEGWRVRKDGTQFWASVTITAVHDDEGVLTGFAKVTRDLTARRAAEDQLRSANRELDRFASVAAHDLGDPLHTIQGFAGLLEREPLSEDGRQFLTHLQTTAGRMHNLLETLLEYARAGGTGHEPHPVHIRAAVDAVLGDLDAIIRERGARVQLDVPDDACVLADRSDVEVVLRNLVANALKFGLPEEPHVEIRAQAAGDRWRLEVVDNGVGIPSADLDRIFTPFERSGAAAGIEGSGLGLAICERLVRRHGGTIAVASEEGQGSRFWVLLSSPSATA